jgi:hypothetical protein
VALALAGALGGRTIRYGPGQKDVLKGGGRAELCCSVVAVSGGEEAAAAAAVVVVWG